MSIATILLTQVSMVALLMLVGIYCKRKGILTLESAKSISDFVLHVVTPAVMMQIILRDFSWEKLPQLGLGMLLAVAYHLLAVPLSRLLIRPDPAGNRDLERFAVICSNAGFMGIPLMAAVLGQEGMVYSAAFLTVMTAYFWTHGLMLIKGAGQVRIKEMLTAPGIVGLAAGFAIFFIGIQLPEAIMGTITYITAMNTPLATIVSGVFIADLTLRDTLGNTRALWATAVRLVIIPLGLVGLLWVMRVRYWMPGAGMLSLGMVISASCSCAGNTVMMPLSYGGDVKQGARLVLLSTVASIATIPLIATLAAAVFL